MSAFLQTYMLAHRTELLYGVTVDSACLLPIETVSSCRIRKSSDSACFLSLVIVPSCRRPPPIPLSDLAESSVLYSVQIDWAYWFWSLGGEDKRL